MSENGPPTHSDLSLVLEVSEAGEPTSATTPAVYSVQGLPTGMLVHIRQQGVDWHMVRVRSNGEMSMGLYDTPDHALRALLDVL
jgi:hypothetical protein